MSHLSFYPLEAKKQMKCSVCDNVISAGVAVAVADYHHNNKLVRAFSCGDKDCFTELLRDEVQLIDRVTESYEMTYGEYLSLGKEDVGV